MIFTKDRNYKTELTNDQSKDAGKLLPVAARWEFGEAILCGLSQIARFPARNCWRL